MIIFTIFKHHKLQLIMKYLILTILLIGFLSTNSFGQVIDPAEIAKRKAENRANNRIDQGIDKGLDKVEGLFKKKDKKEKKNKNDDNQNNQGSQDNSSNSNQNSNQGSNQNSTSSTSNTPSLKTYTKFDFIAGEKVLAMEDFSRSSVGDFPLGWNTNSSAEIVTLEGRPEKWLFMTATGYFQPDFIKDLPENFTLEFDVMTRYASNNVLRYNFAIYSSENPRQDISNKYLQKNKGVFEFSWGGCKSNAGYEIQEKGEVVSKNGSMSVAAFACGKQDYSEAAMVRISIWRQKNRLRVYANETKILDIPQAFNPAIKYNSFRLGSESMDYSNSAENKDEFMVANLRYAVGQPDTRSKLITEGKFVTRGIMFDSGSDKIKPESFGTLKDIAQVLNENAGVKVKIIGHTDSDGNANSNLELSKKRAAAVKQTLASEFGVDASRLETDGKGASEPSEPNTTTEGKANNRRVEFIKL
jgi:outer membrane protein OmpA-like peptidoglycan-associated protein